MIHLNKEILRNIFLILNYLHISYITRKWLQENVKNIILIGVSLYMRNNRFKIVLNLLFDFN